MIFCLLNSIACDFGRKMETMNSEIAKKFLDAYS